jgi:uncharacterized RmlC-like cupin family protein
VGNDERPTDRLAVALATIRAKTLEHLHWHLIEAFNYVISRRAVIRDVERRSYDIGPGSMIYAPPGIAGSHEWDVKEQVQPISPRATTNPVASIQFTVDEVSKQSAINYDYLVRRGGTLPTPFY